MKKVNKETLRMQMLAGIITEGQYKAKLNEEKAYIEYSENNKANIDKREFLNYLYDLLSQAGYELPKDVKDAINGETYDGDYAAITNDFPLSYWENYSLENAKEDINYMLEAYADELGYNSIEDFRVR
jgi:hypothetical protein